MLPKLKKNKMILKIKSYWDQLCNMAVLFKYVFHHFYIVQFLFINLHTLYVYNSFFLFGILQKLNSLYIYEVMKIIPVCTCTISKNRLKIFMGRMSSDKHIRLKAIVASALIIFFPRLSIRLMILRILGSNWNKIWPELTFGAIATIPIGWASLRSSDVNPFLVSYWPAISVWAALFSLFSDIAWRWPETSQSHRII